MPEPAALPLADTSDMAGLHRVFRNAVRDAPQLIGSAANDPERAELVATYYDNVLRLLHAHHDGEDELLTPRLVERATADEVGQVTRIAKQHDEVLADLTVAEARLADFRAKPNPDTAAPLASALAVVNASLTAHLDEEEEVVCPIAAKYVNVAEWGELPAHGFAAFTGDKPWLIIGLIQEQMTPEQVAQMNAHMPPPVFEFWTTVGKGLFDSHMGALRG